MSYDLGLRADQDKTMTNNTLAGLFDDHDIAQRAVNDLVGAGIDRDRISIVANEGNGSYTTERFDHDGNLAAEGATAGLSSGAVVGGVAGLLIGAGFTVLPLAGFLLAGPIAGLIAGAASGAATGGVVGGLIGLGLHGDDAELYAEGVRRGGTLVTVNVEGIDESRVREVLNRDGAVDIQARSADWRQQGFTGYDATAKPFDQAQIADERVRYATPINSDWNDTANAPAPSADATYPTPSSAMDWSDGDRSHFDRTYPGMDFDRHQPAYQYGRDLAGDARYSGDWDANESAFRTQWEDRNPGTWDEFKMSVRHAYDSAKNAVTGGSDHNRATMR